jgi:flagellar hook-associated protein 3 FlgL
MSRVSSFGHQQILLAGMLKNQGKVFTDQEKITSGKEFSDYKGYAGELTTLLGSKHLLTRVKDYVSASKHVKQALDTNEVHVENIYKKMTDVKKTILEAIAQNKTYALGAVMKENYEAIVGSLNSAVGGVYSFSGSRTDTPPISGTKISDLIAATNVNDLFKNNKDKAEAKVDHNVIVEYGMVADEIATEVFQALKNIADYDASGSGPLSGVLTPAQATFLEGELATLDGALANLRERIAQNGTQQNHLDSRLEDHEVQEKFLTVFISDIEDADIAEAIMNLNNDRLALQSSYKVAGEMKNLSLLNYL